MKHGHSLLASLVVTLLVLPAGAPPVRAGGDWNDSAIEWVEFDVGVARARESGKPVCLVFYTEWCPHCTTYSQVFHDARVVEKSRKFVMIRVDRDRNQALSGRFNVDGTYIPRTYFLSPDGNVRQRIHAARDSYKYFYDESDPASLLAGMDAALIPDPPAAEPGTGGGS